MHLRRIASLTAFLSFFIVVLTSIILYIVPQGRVAYWVDWRLWGLSKEEWGAIHINTGFLFLVALLLHIYYNWTPIVFYLKNKAKELKIVTGDFNVALLLILACIVGTYAGIPPFSTIIAISDDIKATAARNYGEPPFGHAELSSLKGFTQKMDIDLAPALERLKEAGYVITGPDQTLLDIAKANDVTPNQIFLAMKPKAEKGPGKASLPESPEPGTGNLTLTEFCTRNNLDIGMVMDILRTSNLVSKPEMTLKGIGEANKKNPLDIYGQIRTGLNAATGE